MPDAPPRVATRNRNNARTLLPIGACLFVACIGAVVPSFAQQAPVDPHQRATSDTRSPPGRMIGGSRDAHGCLVSAGYARCGATGRCERPWELAKARGLGPTFDAYKAFCDAPRSGGDPARERGTPRDHGRR